MTDSGGFDVAEALAHAASAMTVRGNPADTVHAIVLAARTTVPGFNEVSATVVGADGTATTMAATNDLAQDLDSLQYKLGEGPCPSALRDREVVLVQRLQQEERWPRYVARSSAA